MTVPSIEDFLTVGDFMDARPIALRPDSDIVEAVDYLLRHQVTGAPVVDDERRPLGILGERSCLRLLAEGDGAELPKGMVRDYMRIEFQALRPDTDIYYAAGLFLGERNWAFRRFLVVEDGKLVGVLTRYDILRAVQAVQQRQSMAP